MRGNTMINRISPTHPESRILATEKGLFKDPEGRGSLNDEQAIMAHRDIEHFQSVPISVGLEESRESNQEISSDISLRDVDWRSSIPFGLDAIDNQESTATEMTPLNEGTPRHKIYPLLAAQFDVDNFSTASVQSNLFTHSWRRPGLYSISDLCSYITSTPPTRINLMKWCKDRKGVKHEFLVLRVDRPQNKNIWLRLDRRLRQHAAVVEWIFSTSSSGDSAMLCDSLEPLFDSSRSKIKVETEFTIPLSLKTLGLLLSILQEVPAKFKISSENCYFFCSVIYDHLFAMGGGVNVKGGPGKFAMSLAPDVRAEVDSRLKSLLPKASKQASPKKSSPRATVSSSREMPPISSPPLPDHRSDVSRDSTWARSIVPETKSSVGSAPHAAPRRIESPQPMNKLWQRMRARVPSRVEARSPNEHGGMSLGPVTLQPRQVSPMKTLFSDAAQGPPPRFTQRKALPNFDTVRDHTGSGNTSYLMDGWGASRSMKMKSTPDFAPEFESRSTSILVGAGHNTLPMKRRRPTIRREST